MRPKITCLALYPANQADLISPNFSNLISVSWLNGKLMKWPLN